MVKLNSLYYNYRAIRYVSENDQHIKVHDKLYSQLKEILEDFPDLNLKDLKYLSNTHTGVRTNEKYKGVVITKITPIPKYGIPKSI